MSRQRIPKTELRENTEIIEKSLNDQDQTERDEAGDLCVASIPAMEAAPNDGRGVARALA